MCKLWQALLTRTYEIANPASPDSYMSSCEQPPPQQAAEASSTATTATAPAAHQATATHQHAFALIDKAAYVRSQLGLDEGTTLPQQDSDLTIDRSTIHPSIEYIQQCIHLSICIHSFISWQATAAAQILGATIGGKSLVHQFDELLRILRG